jgi:hypothetical protein
VVLRHLERQIWIYQGRRACQVVVYLTIIEDEVWDGGQHRWQGPAQVVNQAAVGVPRSCSGDIDVAADDVR